MFDKCNYCCIYWSGLNKGFGQGNFEMLIEILWGERHIGLLYRFLIFLHIWGFKKGSGTKGRWWKDYRGLVLVFQFQFPFFHLFYVYYVVYFNFLCVSVSDMCCKKIIFVVFFLWKCKWRKICSWRNSGNSVC